MTTTVGYAQPFRTFPLDSSQRTRSLPNGGALALECASGEFVLVLGVPAEQRGSGTRYFVDPIGADAVTGTIDSGTFPSYPALVSGTAEAGSAHFRLHGPDEGSQRVIHVTWNAQQVVGGSPCTSATPDFVATIHDTIYLV